MYQAFDPKKAINVSLGLVALAAILLEGLVLFRYSDPFGVLDTFLKIFLNQDIILVPALIVAMMLYAYSTKLISGANSNLNTA